MAIFGSAAPAGLAVPRVRRRISTLLLAILSGLTGLVLLGLVVMSLRLLDLQGELADLRDSALPRLVKLAQLSQEASATSSIAPALSTDPTRSEFETLLSRIKDKETSQRALTEELAELFRDPDATRMLRRNGDLLIDNLRSLTDVVREQIAVSRRLEDHGETFRRLVEPLSDQAATDPDASLGAAAWQALARGSSIAAETAAVAAAARELVFRLLNTLLDPNRARFSRNRNEIEASVQALDDTLETGLSILPQDPSVAAIPAVASARQLLQRWAAKRQTIYDDKAAELANRFKIKALVEENSLLANRLLGSVSNEFWRASAELDSQIRLVNETTRFTLASIAVVVATFGAGTFFVWHLLSRRIFRRLDRVNDALRAFAENREHSLADPVPDEIGQISNSLLHYMAVIDQREAELDEKSSALEQLSNQLAKYLSPQLYASIFSGRQEVKVASSRKKLTIFFSDIADFTETAERLESEELTQLLNHYLTEMSRIALEHGATVDKYVGDAILIFFGDPESRGVREDALACVEMAIAMRRRMHELADGWREAGIERPLQVRMGIHTGFCTVGNFGSEDRMDYTIIGGAVNTASRLEEVAQPGEILISYETFAQIKDTIRCEEHGEIEVRGIVFPVAAYRVVDSYENLGRVRRRLHEDHPNVKLDLDIDRMTAEDRAQAAAILRRALDLLSHRDRPLPLRRGPTLPSGGDPRRSRSRLP